MNPAAITAEGEAILFDSGLNSHEAEWGGPRPWLGTSTVVKNPARDYAQRIIARKPYEARREDGLWSFIGNTLGTAAIRPITPHRECQTKVDLGAFDRIGHFDGVTFRDEHDDPCPPAIAAHATVEECKAHGTCNVEEEIAMARRQGSLYAADIEAQLEQGNTHFPLAKWFKPEWDPWAKPIVKWPNGVEVTAVNVRIIPRFGPGSITDDCRPVKPFALSRSDKQQVRDFYDRKCKSIHESAFLDKAEERARLFDHSPEGLVEFARRDLVPVATGPLTESLTKWATENLEADNGRKRRDRAQAELKSLLARLGQRETLLPDGTRIALIGDFGGPREPHIKVTPPRNGA